MRNFRGIKRIEDLLYRQSEDEYGDKCDDLMEGKYTEVKRKEESRGMDGSDDKNLPIGRELVITMMLPVQAEKLLQCECISYIVLLPN